MLGGPSVPRHFVSPGCCYRCALNIRSNCMTETSLGEVSLRRIKPSGEQFRKACDGELARESNPHPCRPPKGPEVAGKESVEHRH